MNNREKVEIVKELLAPIDMAHLLNVCDACEDICYEFFVCDCNYVLCEKCRYPPDEEDNEDKRCVCGNIWS